ncbi:MAG: DUF4435 domain-containing protein [Bacteroidales bacterium]|nr:DUF4435 domain-containing protein [Bacteroidales bacterium]
MNNNVKLFFSMNLQLPPQTPNLSEIKIECPCSVVVIGANGSGKSRFGKQILALNLPKGIRIAALSGIYYSTEWEGKRNTEFDRLAQRVTDDYCISAIDWFQAANLLPDEKRLSTLFDDIKQLWHIIFPENQLLFKEGKLNLAPASDLNLSYPIQQMSDGEKVVFYFISSILSAPKDAIFLIEEPEIHLHNSIKYLLWDELEKRRQDCSFVYITHDLDFASSRSNATRIWVKRYDAETNSFDYEVINYDESLPEEIFLEILGSRKSVLFIEGTDSQSIDNKLYTAIFPNFIVKSLGGCQKVIETTKAFNEQKNFHSLEAMGIVDRDRRSSEEIAYLREQHIYVPEVAEVENLLMLEELIKVVARRMLKDGNAIFSQVKNNVIDLFTKDLEDQIILHTKHAVQKKLDRALNLKLRNKEDLINAVEQLQSNINIEQIYYSIHKEFLDFIQKCDYNGILRVYNQKGMLPQSKVSSLCGLSNKNSYLQLVLDILHEGKEDAAIIAGAVKKALLMDSF